MARAVSNMQSRQRLVFAGALLALFLLVTNVAAFSQTSDRSISKASEAQEIIAASPQFTIKPPAGFEIDEFEQETIVDVVFGGKKIATTGAKFDGVTLSFNDPDGLASLIPAVREHAIVADALRSPLAQNRHLTCSLSEPKPRCGYMQPDVVGIIFNPDKLEVLIFISELYTYGRDSRARYLPPPTKGAGVIAGVNMRGFHDFDSGRTTLNSNLDVIAGKGRTHFRADMFANSQGGATLRGANLNYTGRTREASAGFLPFRNGSTLARSDRLAGVRIGSTLKTRMDQSSLRAADIPILVTSSARVEVERDGKVIDIQRVEPGQTTLDTSRFPGGAYEITLKITEDGAMREEKRFYTSGSQLPPKGAPQWYLEAGLPTQNSSQGEFLPKLNKELVLNAGYSKRLSAGFGVAGKVSASERDQYAEASAFLVGPNYTAQGGVTASADGDKGGFARINYNRSKWQISANARTIDAADATGIINNGVYDPFPQSFRQASVRATMKIKKGRVGVRGFYRQTAERPESYFGGPFVEYNVLKTKRSRLALSANYETGNTRNSYFVGLRLNTRLKPPKPKQSLTLSSQANVRSDTAKSNGVTNTREIAEATLRLSKRKQGGEGSEYFAGVRYDKSDVGVRAGIRKRTSIGNLGLELRKNYQRQSNAYVDLTSGIAIGGGHVALFPRFNESGVFVDVDGNSKTKFSVLVNGSPTQKTSKTRTAFVPTSAYDIHDIAIKPVSASDVDYASYTDRVVLYPGNLPVVQRDVNSVSVMVGRAVMPSGEPVSLAAIKSTKQLAVTDEDGYFQLDYTGEKMLGLSRQGEPVCSLDMATALKTADPQSVFVDVGELVCEQEHHSPVTFASVASR